MRAMINVRPVDTTNRLAGSAKGSVEGEIEEKEEGFDTSTDPDCPEVDKHEFHGKIAHAL